MLSESKLNWSGIHVVLLGWLILCLGQDNSFLPFSFHGLCIRIMSLGALLVWFLSSRQKEGAGEIWKYSIWWGWCILTLFQFLVSLNSETPGFALNFLEHRFWISIVLMMLVDTMNEPGVRVWYKRCVAACFVLGVLYGFYQVWVALPHLRESVAGMVEMESEIHKERFMLRLNSNEMFGSRLYANLFGLFASVGFFCCCPRVRLLSSPYRMVLCALMLVALYASHSKGAVLVWLCVAGLWLFEELRRRYACSWFWLLLPVAVGFFGMYSFRDALHASVQIRLDYWKVALAMLQEHPFGVGALNFSEYYGKYMHPMATEVKMAHNDHLQFFCEFGIMGGVMHLVFMAFLVFKTQRHKISSESSSLAQSSTLWWGFLSFSAYLCVTCLQMKLGPWDLPLHGFPFIALGVGAIAFVAHATKMFDQIPWSKWAVLLVVLHACIDMPLYDHSLIFLVLAACFLDQPSPDLEMKWPNLVRKMSLLLCLGGGFLAVQRYQHLLISDWLGMQKEFQSHEVFQQLEAYSFDHQTIEPIFRNWDRLGQPDMGLSEEAFLRKLLLCRPFNSGYALKLAKCLGKAPEAEKWYLKAYQNHPQQPRYAYFFGVYLSEVGKLELSQDFLKKALSRHLEAEKLAQSNSDFKLHLLQPEQYRKAMELTQN